VRSTSQRVATVFFFSGVSCVVLYWADVLGRAAASASLDEARRRGLRAGQGINGTPAPASSGGSASVPRSSDGGATRSGKGSGSCVASLLLAMNLWLYVASALFWAMRRAKRGGYELEIDMTAIMFAVLLLATAVHARRVSALLRRLNASIRHPVIDAMRRKTLRTAAVLCVCFAVKCVLWCWRPVGQLLWGPGAGCISGAWYAVTYPWGFYTVPEVLPTLWLLWVLGAWGRGGAPAASPFKPRGEDWQPVLSAASRSGPAADEADARAVAEARPELPRDQRAGIGDRKPPPLPSDLEAGLALSPRSALRRSFGSNDVGPFAFASLPLRPGEEAGEGLGADSQDDASRAAAAAGWGGGTRAREHRSGNRVRGESVRGAGWQGFAI
jgi:hypothetical protein